MHRHKAVTFSQYCWTHCVTPQECAAHPHKQQAHGNIMRQDVCACGAVRDSEINAGQTNYGPWTTKETK